MTRNHRRRPWPLAAAVLVLLVLSSCSSADDETTTADQALGDEIAAEQNSEDDAAVESTTTTTELSTTTAELSTTTGQAAAESDPALVALGGEFLQTYFSGDREELLAFTADDVSFDNVLWLQAYDQALNYEMAEFSCAATGSRGVRCDVRGVQDISATLGYESKVSFSLRVADGKVDMIRVSYEDEPQVQFDFQFWIRNNHTDLITTGPCSGFVNNDLSGDPDQCAIEFVALAEEFLETDDYVAP